MEGTEPKKQQAPPWLTNGMGGTALPWPPNATPPQWMPPNYSGDLSRIASALERIADRMERDGKAAIAGEGEG